MVTPAISVSLPGDYCINPCFDGWYGKDSGTNRTCELCHAECSTCTLGTFNDCKNCKDAKKVPNASFGNRCMCLSQYYMDNDVNRNCLDCSANCLTCSGGLATNCLTCKSTFYLNPDMSCKTTCQTTPVMTYKHSPDLTCKATCP